MELFKGRTSLFRCTLKLDGVATPPDIASDLRFIVKWKTSDPDELALLTCKVLDGISIGGGAGEFQLKVSASKTSTLPLASERIPLVYELYYVLSSEVYTLDSGKLFVRPTVQATVAPL